MRGEIPREKVVEMYALLIPLLIGCGPTPSSIDIQAEPVVTVHSLEQVALPTAKVLAADKTVIEPAPQIKWEVLPPEVAKLMPTASPSPSWARARPP